MYLGRVEKNTSIKSIRKIGVLVAIDPASNKFKNWHDGFTEAIKKLKQDYDTSIIYFEESNSAKLIDSINQLDFLIVKSGWRSAMDYFLRNHREEIRPYLGLMISASNHGPSKAEQAFYDVVWYETEWYRNKSVRHPNAFHGFGIDTEVMRPNDKIGKAYDIITVGAPRKYKRFEKLLLKKGKRILVGDLKNKDAHSDQLIGQLEQNGVVIEDFQNYEALSKKYQASKLCYIPCELHGGGERALLEARACGLEVEIEPDNPKLKELLSSPIWDANYYYIQLKKGIESVVK